MRCDSVEMLVMAAAAATTIATADATTVAAAMWSMI